MIRFVGTRRAILIQSSKIDRHVDVTFRVELDAVVKVVAGVSVLTPHRDGGVPEAVVQRHQLVLQDHGPRVETLAGQRIVHRRRLHLNPLQC